MRELSLFSGAGGGILASLLLGHTIVGAVEIDEYCCKVLEQRQRDGILERFPIFQTDIRDFIRHGYAELYKGCCDLVSAGFPCQPFSTAGVGLGENDARNMWPATLECIRIIRPRFAFLENVPGLISSGYFNRIIGDLAESGYDARWRLLSAEELGAPHWRKRIWIVAYLEGAGRVGNRDERTESCQVWHRDDVDPGNSSVDDTTLDVPHFERIGRRDRRNHLRSSVHEEWGDSPSQQGGRSEPSDVGQGGQIRHSTGKGLSNGQHGAMGRSAQGHQVKQPQRPTWWDAEPELDRLVHGFPHRVDRIRSAGNAQVPIVAATAWHLLTQGLDL